MQTLTKLLGPSEEEGLKSENSIPSQTRDSKIAQSWVGSSTCSYRMGYSAPGGHYGEKGSCLSNQVLTTTWPT